VSFFCARFTPGFEYLEEGEEPDLNICYDDLAIVE